MTTSHRTSDGAEATAGRPALFLDRDGVVNVEKNYVHRVEDFEFIAGIFDLCRWATGDGMAIVVVTNQAGIARGYYTEEQYQELTRWMCERFLEQRVVINAVYHCPYHPEHGVGRYRRESFDRKPNPGMILRARDELDLDLEKSILVGDRISDIMAGQAAGVGRTALLCPDGTGEFPAKSGRPDFCASSLREVMRLIRGQ